MKNKYPWLVKNPQFSIVSSPLLNSHFLSISHIGHFGNNFSFLCNYLAQFFVLADFLNLFNKSFSLLSFSLIRMESFKLNWVKIAGLFLLGSVFLCKLRPSNSYGYALSPDGLGFGKFFFSLMLNNILIFAKNANNYLYQTVDETVNYLLFR